MDPEVAVDLFVDAVKEGTKLLKQREEGTYDYDDGLEAHDAAIHDQAEEAMEHWRNVKAWVARGGFKPSNWRKVARWEDRFFQLLEADQMLQGVL